MNQFNSIPGECPITYNTCLRCITLLFTLGDDAVGESDMEENPFSLDVAENEELYIDDPKKALKGYFEREGMIRTNTKISTKIYLHIYACYKHLGTVFQIAGCDLPEYVFEELGFGKHLCRVE